MSYSPKLRVPHPRSWPDFEDLCWGLWMFIWKCNTTEKHGRNGQAQRGVDIYGRPLDGPRWAGVQCKGKDAYADQVLTEQEIRAETDKAEHFEPTLSEYIVATTAPRDANLQECVRVLSTQRMAAGLFPVDVKSWDDIEDLLFLHWPPIAARHYPHIFGTEMLDLGKQLYATAKSLIQELVPYDKKVTFTAMVSEDVAKDAQPEPESTAREVVVRTHGELDAAASPEALRMVFDALYSKQQEVAGLSSGHVVCGSDANPLETAIDRALRMKRGGGTRRGASP